VRQTRSGGRVVVFWGLALLLPSFGFAMTSAPAGVPSAIAPPAVTPLTVAPSDGQTRASVRDEANRLNVVWVEQTRAGTSRLLYQIRTLSGAPLTPSILIQESTGRLRRPHLAVDADHILHLLWQERFAKTAGARNPEGTWVHYARLAPTAQDVSIVQQRVLNQRPQALHPDFAVDARGSAYAVWEEGDHAIVIAKVAGHRQPVVYQRITSDFGKDGHGYPALAVDGRGKLHLAWSVRASSGQEQIVYAALALKTFGSARLSGQAVYTSALPGDQPKRIRVAEQTGLVTIHWKNKHGEGPLGRLVATTGSVTFIPKSGVIDRVNVLDASLASAPEPWRAVMPLAVAGKPPLFRPAATATVQSAPPADQSRLRLARFDDSITKLKLSHALAFSTWSGAPPSVQGVSDSPSPLAAYVIRSVQPSRSFQNSSISLKQPRCILLKNTAAVSSRQTAVMASCLIMMES
jgi:hypothetical protein